MLANVQALRACAAILVVLYHAIPHLTEMDGSYPLVAALGKLGFIGVDIFFVISGYVISLTTTDKPRNTQSLVAFIRKRSARIYLGYWPFLILMFLIFKIYAPYELKGSHLIDSLFLYTNHMKYLLPVAWSLTYELYFYLLFIPLFFIPKIYLKYLMLVLFLLILIINLFAHIEYQSTPWFLTNPYLLEFLSGALLYHYQQKIIHKKYLLVAVIAAVAGFYLGNHHHYDEGLARVMTFGAFAAAMFWLFIFMETEIKFVFGKIWQELGDASYTIYLAHVPLLYLFYFTGLRDWLHLQHPALILTSFIAWVSAILFFSVWFYRKVEEPLYKSAYK